MPLHPRIHVWSYLYPSSFSFFFLLPFSHWPFSLFWQSFNKQVGRNRKALWPTKKYVVCIQSFFFFLSQLELTVLFLHYGDVVYILPISPRGAVSVTFCYVMITWGYFSTSVASKKLSLLRYLHILWSLCHQYC